MKKIVVFLLIIISGLLVYGFFIGNKEVNVKEYLVINDKLPDKMNGLKIAHFSDILFDKKDGKDMLTKVANQINEQKCDVIVFTGGLTRLGEDIENKEEISLILKNMNASIKKYAILGDTDYNTVSEILKNGDFEILDNSSDYIFKDDQTPIVIAGGDNLTNDTFPSKDTINYNLSIGLIHKPDDFDNYKDLNIDIFLAGHSLGGQIRIPFIGPVLRLNGAKKYLDDYYKHSDQELYVSYGIGYSKYHIRLFANPEISIYRLYNK